MSKYRVITPGKSLICAECGKLFNGANCRNLAIKCYDSHFIEPAIRPHLPYSKEPGLPGDGIEHPDRNGHWRRVNRRNPEHNRIEINKSLYQAGKREKEAVRDYLNSLVKKPHNVNPRYSPLQRLSFAFKNHNWEAVKQAAIAYGYSQAVSRRLDALNIPDILREALQLEELLDGILRDADFIGYKEADLDIKALQSRLEVEALIDDLDLEDLDNDND